MKNLETKDPASFTAWQPSKNGIDNALHHEARNFLRGFEPSQEKKTELPLKTGNSINDQILAELKTRDQIFTDQFNLYNELLQFNNTQLKVYLKGLQECENLTEKIADLFKYELIEVLSTLEPGVLNCGYTHHTCKGLFFRVKKENKQWCVDFKHWSFVSLVPIYKKTLKEACQVTAKTKYLSNIDFLLTLEEITKGKRSDDFQLWLNQWSKEI